MLARYRIVRGKRPPGDPLPDGRRIDVRKHTRHVLRPPKGVVEAYLANPDAAAFREFSHAYDAAVAHRFQEDREPFDALARAAMAGDVYLGCSCPSAANPDVHRCHTVRALRFMKAKYPKLRVVLPR